MGTTLTGTTPQDTYDSLIKVTDNGPLSGTAKYLSDGLGNDSKLALSTGNIGVNNTSPSYQLDVSGDIRSTANLRSNNGTVDSVLSYTNEPAGVVGTITNHPFTIWSNSAERIRITSAGNVGIGISSPAAKLDVVGTNRIQLRTDDAIQEIRGISADGTLFKEIGINGLDIRFYASSSERMRVTTNGLTFNGDTAAANALDDYEEGTWTPNILFGGGSTGVTYGGSNGGTYTKVGRKVSVNAYLDISNKGTSTGTAQISNLPFTIGSGASNYGAPSFRPVSITFADFFMGYGDVNGTTITLQQATSLGVVSSLTDANFGVSTNIILSFTYFTA